MAAAQPSVTLMLPPSHGGLQTLSSDEPMTDEYQILAKSFIVACLEPECFFEDLESNGLGRRHGPWALGLGLAEGENYRLVR